MKKIVALFLVMATFVCILTSCSVDLEDRGPVIEMYLTDEPKNLDPALMIYDKNYVKYAGVMFEGLFEISSDGKLVNGTASKWWTDYDEKKGEYKLFIELKASKWNDGRVLSADHYAWAWKRILSPETNSPAAALLYDVKNAKAVKAGDITVDNVGIAAVSQTLLEIEFEKPIDVELFLENLASPSLVAVRDDVAGVAEKVDTWASKGTDDMLSNGPFALKGRTEDGLYRLEMNNYYLGQVTQEKGYMSVIKPYRLLTDYQYTLDQQAERFDNGQIYYLGELSKEKYEEKKSQLTTQDLLSSYTYFYDCANPVLSDPAVRSALSSALDRNHIAQLIGRGTKASQGFVSDGTFGSSMGKSYREEAGAVYGDQTALPAGAKKGAFTLTYRTDRDYDKLVAEYAKQVWDGMGYKVTLVGLDLDEYVQALYAGDWDVIALDYQGLSTSAYAYLAPFATKYSGMPVSVEDGSAGYTPHVTNFSNAEYDSMVDAVLAETTRAGRAKLLVELEKKFAQLCPATALCTYTDYYLASSSLKNLKSSWYGYRIFDEVLLDNYQAINEVYYSVQESLAEESRKAAEATANKVA